MSSSSGTKHRTLKMSVSKENDLKIKKGGDGGVQEVQICDSKCTIPDGTNCIMQEELFSALYTQN